MSNQYQSDSIAKLVEALVKAQSEMSHAHKGAANPFYKSKYADLPTVIDAAKPHLPAHGLCVTQVTDVSENGLVAVVTQLNHISGEWMRGYYPVKPIKEDPQAYGSAVTYARRYAYQAIVGIATSLDDDDGNAASNIQVKPESSASVQRRMKTLLDGLAASDDPTAYWIKNKAAIDEYLDFEEKEQVQHVIGERAFMSVARLLESSDDPAETWGKHQRVIDKILAFNPKAHQTLLLINKQRKEELESKQ